MGTRRSLRRWLLGANAVLLLVAASQSARADGAGEAAAKVAGACCAGAVGALADGSSAPAPRKGLPAAPIEGEPAVDTLFRRCLDGVSAEDCWELGRRFEEGDGLAQSDKQALVHYRKALRLDDGNEHYLGSAERVAERLGCADAFDCGSVSLLEE